MKLKKFLSGIIVGAMAFGVISFSAFAETSVWDGNEYDISWYDPEISDYEISTAAQLAGLSEIVNGTATSNGETVSDNFQKKTISLTNDIDLSNYPWTPIGGAGYEFKGSFDGGDHIISNLYINNDKKSYIGLFGRSVGASIQNFKIHNADVTGYLNVGAVVGEAYTGSPVQNITVYGTVKIKGFCYVGGITGGQFGYTSLINCDVIADDNTGSQVYANSIEGNYAYRSYVGGITGQRGEGNMEIRDCDAKIDVIGTVMNIGGISGNQQYGNKFINCTYEGNLYLENTIVGTTPAECCVGAIAGSVLTNKGTETIMQDCKFTGTATIGGQDVTAVLRPTEWYSPAYEIAGNSSIQAEVNGVSYASSTDDMAQVEFGGSLDGATISEDNLTLTQDDETVTAWKGEISGGVSGDITVAAIKDIDGDGVSDTAKTTFEAPVVEGNALFYVLVNTQPDRMAFSYSNIE